MKQFIHKPADNVSTALLAQAQPAPTHPPTVQPQVEPRAPPQAAPRASPQVEPRAPPQAAPRAPPQVEPRAPLFRSNDEAPPHAEPWLGFSSDKALPHAESWLGFSSDEEALPHADPWLGFSSDEEGAGSEDGFFTFGSGGDKEEKGIEYTFKFGGDDAEKPEPELYTFGGGDKKPKRPEVEFPFGGGDDDEKQERAESNSMLRAHYHCDDPDEQAMEQCVRTAIQSQHGTAVRAALDFLTPPPRWLWQQDPLRFLVAASSSASSSPHVYEVTIALDHFQVFEVQQQASGPASARPRKVLVYARHPGDLSKDERRLALALAMCADADADANPNADRIARPAVVELVPEVTQNRWQVPNSFRVKFYSP